MLALATLDALAANGFVVPARLRYPNYAWALHEVTFRFERGRPDGSPVLGIIHVRAGDFDGWVKAAWSGAYGTFGGRE